MELAGDLRLYYFQVVHVLGKLVGLQLFLLLLSAALLHLGVFRAQREVKLLIELLLIPTVIVLDVKCGLFDNDPDPSTFLNESC